MHHQNHSQIGRPHAITCLQDPTGSLQVSRLKLSTWRHLVLRRINVLRFSTFVGSPTCVNTLQDFTRFYKYLSYLSCSIICKCSMMNIMRKNIHVLLYMRLSDAVKALVSQALRLCSGLLEPQRMTDSESMWPTPRWSINLQICPRRRCRSVVNMCLAPSECNQHDGAA